MRHLESASDLTQTLPIGKALEHSVFMRGKMRRKNGNNIPRDHLAYNRVAWVRQLGRVPEVLGILLEM
jgi:hypothetical protein